jgi:AraC-like DNA-binding protein
MRCSERYLFRVFEDDALSLERTLWQMRLERCRAQLQEARGPASVAEIAFANGFRSPAHFSRLFKAETGLSPRAYRQALGAPAQAAR